MSSADVPTAAASNAEPTANATLHASSSSSSSSSLSSAAASLPSSILSNAHRADLHAEEFFNVLDESGNHTGKSKLRRLVHAEGDWHACVHIWLQHADTGKLLLQQRALCKDSFPGRWDVSCAGHLSAGESAASAAQAELAEELGIAMPQGAKFEQFFRSLPRMKREVISQGGRFLDGEHTWIYVVEGCWALRDFRLQAEEVAAVEWRDIEEIVQQLERKSPEFVDFPDLPAYRAAVFDPLLQRAKELRAASRSGSQPQQPEQIAQNKKDERTS